MGLKEIAIICVQLLSLIATIVAFWDLSKYIYEYYDSLINKESKSDYLYYSGITTDSMTRGFLQKRIVRFAESQTESFKIIISIITIISILCVLFTFGFVIIKGINSFGFFWFSISFINHLLIIISYIICYFFIRYLFDKEREKSFLKSRESLRYHGFNINQKVSEVNLKRIPTYPRITIYDMDEDDKYNRMIFDSSDPIVINRKFGFLEKVGKYDFDFEEIIIGQYLWDGYIVSSISVFIQGEFNDYSVISPIGTNHSRVYQGRDIPYNIHIKIEINKNRS